MVNLMMSSVCMMLYPLMRTSIATNVLMILVVQIKAVTAGYAGLMRSSLVTGWAVAAAVFI